MGQKRKKSAKLTDIDAEVGVKVAVGDDIVIDSGSAMPFVARVQAILPAAKKKENGRLKVSWYYFPEDTTGGRQVFHSKCEIFRSNHDDIISTQSVVNACKVLRLQQWCAYHAESVSHKHTHTGPHSNHPFPKPQDPSGGGHPRVLSVTQKDSATQLQPPRPDRVTGAQSTAQAQPHSMASDAAQKVDAPEARPATAAVEPSAEAHHAHRDKRRLPNSPKAQPASPAAASAPTAAQPVHEVSPEPAAERPLDHAADAKVMQAKHGTEASGGAQGDVKSARGEGDARDEASDRELSPMVFLCRHAYDAKRHKWVDEEVPLYCVCCMPYNPDLDMVECASCGEWFHGECLGMSTEQFEQACKQEDWTCIACTAKRTKTGTE